MSTPPPGYGYGYPQQPLPLGPPPYPPPPPPAPVRQWWQHPALIITALVLFPPGGIALAWLSRWSRTTKIVATVLAGLWFLTPFLADPPKAPKADAAPKPAVTAPATAGPSASPSPGEPPSLVGQSLKEAKAAAYDAGYRTISHDASDDDAGQWDDGNWKVCFQTLAAKRSGAMPTLDLGVVRNEWPCPAKDGEPIPYPKMPKVVGQTFAKASEALTPLAFEMIERDSAYTDVTLPAAVDDWTVCFQGPAEGKEITSPKTTTARLTVVAPGTACPTSPSTELRPDPTPPPGTGGDDAEGSDSDFSSSGGSTGSGGSSSSGTVTPGAFCAPAGSTGVSRKGVLYTCKGPDQPRWRR
ncbi:PASTA domain-containing protein [Streptomyces sp. RS10V-4]|uniref:PASTA domain-containing protein n=1 Tax=Streptomyces rhizoryzae TaxID=2932493 RepID=UPI002006418C|nr:PASTA domain-containing protein [Streptomyces rhizoryzae]MCK7623532.1 PASTA domain-containing protein [Streptomyces rhizoryzae]